MAISAKLRAYMKRCGTSFDQVPHSRSFSMSGAAHSAHVSGNNVAKGVVLKTDDQYILAVLPASRRVNMTRLRRWLGRDVGLATEAETTSKFPDCEFGAVPPVGAAYDLITIVDDDILGEDEIYFEGGDHRTLVAIASPDWQRLMRNVDHFSFSS